MVSTSPESLLSIPEVNMFPPLLISSLDKLTIDIPSFLFLSRNLKPTTLKTIKKAIKL